MNAAKSGLPGEVDPFEAIRRRQEALKSHLPSTRAEDEPEDADSEPASKVASSRWEEPAPPPAKEVKGRVQMNARIFDDRMRALKKYQFKHGATFQAVVDQMVDEYLERRGLI